MIKGGYILQPRCYDNSDIANKPPHVREIWLYLLRNANYTENPTYGRKIQRGQLFTSYKKIREALSWYVGYRKETYKKHQCETAMKLLTRLQMIQTTKTTRGIIVTICNYEYYQNPKNYETDRENHNETTTKPHETDTIHKKERNKEQKNNKTEKTSFSETSQKNLEFKEKSKLLQKRLKKLHHERNEFIPKQLDRTLTEKDFKEIRLMFDNDKIQDNEIREILDFMRSQQAGNNGFLWINQVQSVRTFRSKAQKILPQARQSQKAPGDNGLPADIKKLKEDGYINDTTISMFDNNYDAIRKYIGVNNEQYSKS